MGGGVFASMGCFLSSSSACHMVVRAPVVRRFLTTSLSAMALFLLPQLLRT